VLNRPSGGLFAAVGVVSAFALFVSLFLSWYEVDQGSVTKGPAGFVAVFGQGSADAWDAISSTSYVLAGCALVIPSCLARTSLPGRELRRSELSLSQCSL
jgi:hypothetical protein